MSDRIVDYSNHPLKPKVKLVEVDILSNSVLQELFTGDSFESAYEYAIEVLELPRLTDANYWKLESGTYIIFAVAY